MALRSCIYKKCGNYVNLKDRSFNDVKLFSFPKNPERRKKWMELGEVPQNLPESMYFLCSDHFDKKFLAINNRRTVLVGEALPFPYVETEVDESNKEETDLNYLMYELSRTNNSDKEYISDQDIVVESTTISSNVQDTLKEHFDSPLNKEEPEEYIIFSDDEKDEPNTYNNKRKADNTFTQATTSKIIKVSRGQKTLRESSERINDNIIPIAESKNDVCSNKESIENYINPSELVDANHVTTFIFKGEEYVQMPKDYYLNEKIELRNKITKMEHTLQAIKRHISVLDI